MPVTNNIFVDPLFVDTTNSDYRIMPWSLCVDAGTTFGAPPVDFEYNDRPMDGDCDGEAVADIGAYEFAPIQVEMVVNPATIRLQPNRVITAAVLSTETFNAKSIDPASILFGPGLATEMHGKGHWEDVNSDGLTDLLLHFRCKDTGIQVGDESAMLYGRTTGGKWVAGRAPISTIGR